MVIATAFREAAARNLHAAPVFSYFHRPSSSFRVMMTLLKPKRPPAAAFASIGYLARCPHCGELWRVDAAPASLGDPGSGRRCAHREAPPLVAGPLWLGPLHDAAYARRMAVEARRRDWVDAESLLSCFVAEAEVEADGAVIFYHLGEVQRALAAADVQQPPLRDLIERLRASGFAASLSHMERKAIKTNASLRDIVEVSTRQCSVPG